MIFYGHKIFSNFLIPKYLKALTLIKSYELKFAFKLSLQLSRNVFTFFMIFTRKITLARGKEHDRNARRTERQIEGSEQHDSKNVRSYYQTAR